MILLSDLITSGCITGLSYLKGKKAVRIKVYILQKPLELLINALSNNSPNGDYFHWRKLLYPSVLAI